MSTARVPFSYALLRVVPHPYTGAFVNIGIVLQSRPAAYVGLRAVTDEERLRALVPDADTELLARYLRSCEAIAAGDEAAGEIALLSPPERFHWLTAPRSDVIQASPVHSGLCEDPAATLNELFDRHIGASK